ncbi:hypothetical protein DV702_16015 [Sporosarcina sp. PTS2304]|uniref:hypothetical protein n=1 Tax=Sporosarcina sp. PTS2304 TaxID=2283194 RepID=UPI000E0D403D|nr:hypothetical protein [Sporosarcina sp. PTS2304]AXI01090.1 hypothetical protein DV702_16015 [Sporosarcina sp. PTS2304]
MLKLMDVTINYNGRLILHNCNCEINPQSIIVAKNDINTEIIARTLSGLKSVNDGEIHLTENNLNKKEKDRSKIFFLITGNYHELWKNYRLKEISQMMKRTFKGSALCEKYNISSQASIDSLTKFQRLIYLISIGQSFNRTIFIFDQPTKYFDYEDLERFYDFLNEDFLDANYIILTNRFEEIFTRLSKQIYEIDSTKSIVLKGGEESVGG